MKKLFILLFILLVFTCEKEVVKKDDPCACIIIDWAFVEEGVYEQTNIVQTNCSYSSIDIVEAIDNNPPGSDVQEIKCTHDNE